MDLTRSEMQKIVDEAPEGATHIINETYVKMNNDSVDSGWCKVWFEGKWMRNGYISNCTSLHEIRKVLVSKAFKGAHVNDGIVAIAFSVESPEEKEALDNIKVTKVDDKQSVKVETEHQKEMAEFGWDGEGLPPVGVKAVFSYADFELPSWLEIGQKVEIIAHQFNNSIPVAVFRVETAFGMEVSFAGAESFSKPELPEDKEERERLESAYDLYCEFTNEGSVDATCMSFYGFCQGLVKIKWLAIVDKTKYRKGVE